MNQTPHEFVYYLESVAVVVSAINGTIGKINETIGTVTRQGYGKETSKLLEQADKLGHCVELIGLRIASLEVFKGTQ